MSPPESQRGHEATRNQEQRSSPWKQGWRPAALALLLYSVTATVLCWPSFTGRTSLASDASLDSVPGLCAEKDCTRGNAPRAWDDLTASVLEFPVESAFARGLHAGRVDHWAPFSAGGMPLWAEQEGVLAPDLVPFWLWPSPQGYNLSRAMRLVLGALGAYCLARTRRLGPPAAALTGLLFELSGTSLAWLSFSNSTAVYCLPWVLAAVLSLREGVTRRRIAALALTLGVTLNTGHPGVIALVLLGWGLAVAVALVRRAVTRHRPLRFLGAALLGLALGLALGGPRLLPLAEFLSEGYSYKQDPESSAAAAHDRQGWFARTAPLSIVAPAAFESRALREVSHWPHPFEPALPLLAWWLGLAALLSGLLEAELVLALVVGALYALGPPGFVWLTRAPGLSLVLPWYAWPLVVVGLTQAAGSALERPRELARWAWVCSALGLVGLLGATLLLGVRGDDYYRSALAALTSPWPLWLSVANIVLAIGLGLALWRGTAGRQAARFAALPLAVMAALLIWPLVNHPPSQRLAAGPTPTELWLAENTTAAGLRAHSSGFEVLIPRTNALVGISDFRVNGALVPERYASYVELLPEGRQATNFGGKLEDSPLLALAAVGWIMRNAAEPDAEQGNTGTAAWEGSGVRVFPKPDALPRARLVERASWVPSEEQAREQLSALVARARDEAPWSSEQGAEGGPSRAMQDVSPALGELRESVILEGAPPAEPSLGAFTDAGPLGEARLLPEPDPDRLTVLTTTARTSVLVVADTWMSSWRAELDGVAVPLYPANVAFRGVLVPAGQHTVTMWYAPVAFYAGLVLCALGVLGCAALVLPRREKRR